MHYSSTKQLIKLTIIKLLKPFKSKDLSNQRTQIDIHQSVTDYLYDLQEKNMIYAYDVKLKETKDGIDIITHVFFDSKSGYDEYTFRMIPTKVSLVEDPENPYAAYERAMGILNPRRT